MKTLHFKSLYLACCWTASLGGFSLFWDPMTPTCAESEGQPCNTKCRLQGFLKLCQSFFLDMTEINIFPLPVPDSTFDYLHWASLLPYAAQMKSRHILGTYIPYVIQLYELSSQKEHPFLHPIDPDCAQHRLILQSMSEQTFCTKWSIPVRAHWKLSAEMSQLLLVIGKRIGNGTICEVLKSIIRHSCFILLQKTAIRVWF